MVKKTKKNEIEINLTSRIKIEKNKRKRNSFLGRTNRKSIVVGDKNHLLLLFLFLFHGISPNNRIIEVLVELGEVLKPLRETNCLIMWLLLVPSPSLLSPLIPERLLLYEEVLSQEKSRSSLRIVLVVGAA